MERAIGTIMEIQFVLVSISIDSLDSVRLMLKAFPQLFHYLTLKSFLTPRVVNYRAGRPFF